MGKRAGDCTVTAPGIERRCESPQIGLSLAQTIASRTNHEVTVYVRDTNGETTSRVERDHEGIVRTYQLKGASK